MRRPTSAPSRCRSTSCRPLHPRRRRAPTSSVAPEPAGSSRRSPRAARTRPRRRRTLPRRTRSATCPPRCSRRPSPVCRTSSSTRCGSRRSCFRSTRPPASQYGVRWEVLAAINEIETDYGRNLSVSSAGARGLDAVHARHVASYGVDANGDGTRTPTTRSTRSSPRRATCAPPGPDRPPRRAIFAYNHADWYVDSVLLRARAARRPAGGPRRRAHRPHAGAVPRRAERDLRRDVYDRLAQARSQAGNASVAVEARRPHGHRHLRRRRRPGDRGAGRQGRRDRHTPSDSAASSSSATPTATRTPTAHLGSVARLLRRARAATARAQRRRRPHAPRAPPSPTEARRLRRPPASAPHGPTANTAAAPHTTATRAAGRSAVEGAPVRATRRAGGLRAGGQRQLSTARPGGARRSRSPTARSRSTSRGPPRCARPGHAAAAAAGVTRHRGPILGHDRQDVAAAGTRPPHMCSRSARPARRSADRPQADPRRLAPAGVQRDLPREGQPGPRRRRRDALDRADPADEQGGARAPRARQPAHRRSTVRPPATSSRASSTAACSRRSSSSPSRGLKPTVARCAAATAT